MKRFTNILLLADTDTDNSAALQRAITLANNNQASLTICAAVDSVPGELQMAVTAITPAELIEIAVSEKRERLEEAIKTHEGSAAIEVKVLVGKVFVEIIRQVLRNKYDLVIKRVDESIGPGATLFGSTDMHLMRKCPCPVWIITSAERHQYRRILAAVDQDPEDAVKDRLNRQILEISTSLALANFSELHVVHAWQLFGEGFLRSARTGLSDADVDAMVAAESVKREQWLENLVSSYGKQADSDAVDYLAPHLHVLKGSARRIVPAKARELGVDLVVMGTVARTGIAGFFMGNTAESILNQLDCSVLTVKPPGFVSPITLPD